MSYKNIVIVGASTGGLATALNLSKTIPDSHRIILIEANPAAYWSIAALRASVQPGFESEVVRDITTDTIFGASSRHIAIASTKVVELHPDYLLVNRDITSLASGSSLQGDNTRVPFDKAVLAIGAEYGFPARISVEARSKQDIFCDFQKLQNQIKESNKLLVIGGGPTGVEFIGEVLDVYPEKAACTTLITRGSYLISNGNDAFISLSRKLVSQLKSKGVTVILDDSLDVYDLKTGAQGQVKTFHTAAGKSIDADFVLLAAGGKPNTALIRAVDPTVLNSVGRVMVNPDLTVKSSNPLWKNYFVPGDANDLAVPKTSFMAEKHGEATAKNILILLQAEAREQNATLSPAPAPPGSLILVPLGRSGGAGYLFYFAVGAWITSFVKGKTLFLSNFHAKFKQ